MKKRIEALFQINVLLEEGAPPNEIEQYSGETWFELLTRMIDGLRNAEIKMVDGLVGAPLSAPMEGPKTSGKMAQYHDFLKTLPILSSLEDRDLDELLSLSQLRNCAKDKLLFLRDEPTTRMYIILEGWVKAYNGLETGEEAVLQMLGAGETLLETAVLLNTPTPVNAQVVEHALLLSIPAPVIRQQIQSNPQLAVNMLNTVSLRSQRLVQQLELSRLKTAQERVGWFLLRLALNQKPADGLIYLPYKIDHRLLSGYAAGNIFAHPAKFKKQGFEISTDTIRIPHGSALCDYCDSELAGQCTRFESEDCPNRNAPISFFAPQAEFTTDLHQKRCSTPPRIPLNPGFNVTALRATVLRMSTHAERFT